MIILSVVLIVLVLVLVGVAIWSPTMLGVTRKENKDYEEPLSEVEDPHEGHPESKSTKEK